MSPLTATAIDLFAGCGGLTLGLRQAGFRVIGAIEIDALSVETYRRNHPDAVIWQRDIRDVTVSEMSKRLSLQPGSLDLLAGCPPCQGFSSIKTLNRGRTIRDPRQKDLVFEFSRFVEGLKPRAIMMENVPGLIKDHRMPRLIDRLNNLGYTNRYEVLDAADYGVPQRRRRVIVIGSRYGNIEFAQPRSLRRTVHDTIGYLASPETSDDPLHRMITKRSERVLRLIRMIPKNGGSRTDLKDEMQLDCHRKCNGFKDVYGRMAWHRVSPTITGGCINPSKGRFLHPEQDRSITLREAALLQSFPPDYYFSLRRGRFPAAALIGNALPPEFIRRHASMIRKHLEAAEGCFDHA